MSYATVIAFSVFSFAAAPPALAQSGSQPSSVPPANPAASPWSVEVGLGLDNSVSGNINSSGVGRINDQAVVVLKNSYESVYGTGFHLRFGGGYPIDDVTEVRATFTFQSLDADLVPLGDIGASKLYAQYAITRASVSTWGCAATWT